MKTGKDRQRQKKVEERGKDWNEGREKTRIKIEVKNYGQKG